MMQDRLPLFHLSAAPTSPTVATRASSATLFTEPRPASRRPRPMPITLASGIDWDSLRDLALDTAIARATKSAIWPAPNYRELIAGGTDPHSVRALKWLYERAAKQPRSQSWTGLYTFARGLQTLRETVSAIMNEQPDALRKPALVEARTRQASRDHIARDLPTLADLNITLGQPSDASYLLRTLLDTIGIYALQPAWNKATRQFRRELAAGHWPPAAKRASQRHSALRREGPNWREEQGITLAEALRTFEIGSIEINPKVAGTEREMGLEQITDAFHDFAEAFGIPDAACGLAYRLRLFLIKGNRLREAEFDERRMLITIPTNSSAPQLAHAMALAIAHIEGDIFQTISKALSPAPASPTTESEQRIARYQALIARFQEQIDEQRATITPGCSAGSERDAMRSIQQATQQISDLEKWIADEREKLATGSLPGTAPRPIPLQPTQFADKVVAYLLRWLLDRQRRSDFLCRIAAAH